MNEERWTLIVELKFEPKTRIYLCPCRFSGALSRFVGMRSTCQLSRTAKPWPRLLMASRRTRQRCKCNVSSPSSPRSISQKLISLSNGDGVRTSGTQPSVGCLPNIARNFPRSAATAGSKGPQELEAYLRAVYSLSEGDFHMVRQRWRIGLFES